MSHRTSTYDNATGYEHFAPVRSPGHSDKPEKRDKITDAELLVLPKFNYDIGTREDFERKFKDLIRRLRLTFLVWNVMEAVSQMVSREEGVKGYGTHAASKLFSPRDLGGTARGRGDDLVPEACGMYVDVGNDVEVSRETVPFMVVREDPRGPVPVNRNVTRGAMRTPVYEEAPSAFRPFSVQGGRATQRTPPNESEHGDEYVIQRGHRRNPRVEENVMYSEREYDGEGDEDVDDWSDRSQRSNSHRSSQTSRTRDSLGSGWRESYPSIGSLGSRSPNWSSSSSSAHSDPADAKHAGRPTVGVGRSPLSNAGSRRGNHPRGSFDTGPPNDSNTFMARQQQESQYYQMAAMQEAMLGMQQQLQQHKLIMQQQGALALSQNDQHLSAPIIQEKWVLDARKKIDFTPMARWKYPDNHHVAGRGENEWEQTIRARLWSHMIKQLPIELYKDLTEGDVAGAYDRICTVGKPSAIAQSMQLRNKLTKVASKQNKANKPLLGWLQEVFDVMQDLHTLNDAVSVKEVRQYLYAAFEDDPKYADFIKDLTRNPHMGVAQMRACLVAVATVKKDLVADLKVTNRWHGMPDNRKRS